jgi:GrpB-like predicted nucleotidyltransferase (UPF0157 family)
VVLRIREPEHLFCRDAYARLKQDLAVRFRNDRIGYTEGKARFVAETIALARAAAAERTGGVSDRP